jgi:hypothetical protein
MRFPRKTVAVILLVVAGGFACWRLSFPAVSYRYRLTVAVETDGEVHTGSSVVELQFRFFPRWLLSKVKRNYNVWVTGQAVLIDLGGRGVLVAALDGAGYERGTTAIWLPGCAFLPVAWKDASDSPMTAENQWKVSQLKEPTDLGPACMPAFYWFSSPADLTGAKAVKLAEFASVIGGATRLVSAQVEITSDPPVIDIDKKLPAYGTLTAPPANGLYTTPGGLTVRRRQFMMKADGPREFVIFPRI